MQPTLRITGTADQLRYQAMMDKLTGTTRIPGIGGTAVAGAGTTRIPGIGGTAVAGGSLAARINLTLPALTVLGLADNPGESPGWGSLDPALVRDLAARAAAAGDGSEWHLTVVDEHGWAVAHGCAVARPGTKQGKTGKAGRKGKAGARGRQGKADPRSIGTLGMRLPGGQEVEFTLYPIPVTGPCDHRYAGTGHDPSDLLRHLTEIRDGTCTRPGCARTAGRCDFEHVEPFEKGGLTCLCNGDPKCRRCHQVKQAMGWVNEQVGGFHYWTTPAGRTYVRGPAEYVA